MTDEEITQAREMLKDGKGYIEVAEFMRNTYNVAVDPGDIRRLGKAGGGVSSGKKRGPKPKKRRVTRWGVKGKPRGRKIVAEVADDPDCALVPICMHAKICNPEICRFRNA